MLLGHQQKAGTGAAHLILGHVVVGDHQCAPGSSIDGVGPSAKRACRSIAGQRRACGGIHTSQLCQRAR